jgi:hypothetical protein
MLRKLIPNSQEEFSRNKVNRPQINVDVQVDERAFIRVFEKGQLDNLVLNRNAEKQSYLEFSKLHTGNTEIFYPQFLKGTALSDEQLEAIDFIQDIPNNNIRLLFQKHSKISLGEFKERIVAFKDSNVGKRIIPVVDLDVNTNDSLQIAVLSSKCKFVAENFQECILIYRGRKSYRKAWRASTAELQDISWGVFEVPVRNENTFALEIFCFSTGARFICHYRSSRGWSGTPLFLNKDFTLKPLQSSDNGEEMYGNMTRKQYLINDGRKSYVRHFSKWDRVVQTNALCRNYIVAEDLSTIQIIKDAFSHFQK